MSTLHAIHSFNHEPGAAPWWNRAVGGSLLPRGFTLIDLLVVTATIGILAALLLPALNAAKLKAQGIQCMNNHKHLTLAWKMYSYENSDTLLRASGTGPYTS